MLETASAARQDDTRVGGCRIGRRRLAEREGEQDEAERIK
jgi:hypothetical protein